MAQQKGSNDLNMLLKAKVVKLKVELDYKNSKLPSQVDKISKFLEKKPVKLKVELQASARDLNSQINKISKTLKETKSFKPLRIGVEMDVKGSAEKIKKQLKEVMDVVSSFNKQYSKQLQEMQRAQVRAQNVADKAKGMNIPTGAGVQNFNNIKNYVNQLTEAERQLRSKFADGKGLFSSLQLKDAQGNLRGFIASLERASGVIEKVRYEWNKDKNQFQVIDRQTATNTEKMVHKSMQSLQDLQRELSKTGNASRELTKEYKALEQAGSKGTLTSDMVKSFQTKVKNAQQEVQVQKQLNDLKREEAKLLRDIANATKGKNTQGVFKTEVQDLMSKTRKAQNMDALKDIRVELGQLTNKVSEYNAKQKEASQVDKQRQSAMKQLNRYLQSTYTTNGALARENIKAVEQMARRAKTTKQMAEVQRQLNSMYRQEQNIKTSDAREKALQKLKNTMINVARATGKEVSTIESRFKQLERNIGGNLSQINNQIKTYEKMIARAKNSTDIATIQRQANSIVTGVNNKKVRDLINQGDVTKLKDYLAQVEKLNIATAKVATNSKGVTKITTTLESTGKTARQVTYEIDALNGSLRRTGQSEVFNRNANLGIFEQLRIAMARVPVWMTAMTAFYGSIRVVQSMTDEILKLDKALTELKRVASDSISIDMMFEGGVKLAKELGNNVHDVMNSISELARTYGDFNERQLLAITKTATLMSNVSDLNAEEATNSLVGTMNAFNITAEESIRIVDAFNEVDNNFAISTQQLAEGMSKTASTAKTFGVTMEESVGHITAIGAVTMESGKIIGNSLKTIYSRITTLEGSADVLGEVGVAIKDQKGDVREVNDILKDLASVWGTISAEQRQNIAVTVAGRYQLSRFLALMNNWEMATEATNTAVHSQGSAMRENQKYLESFEARINSLKNGWTELSSTVGEAILSDGLLTVIGLLKNLAEIGVTVTKTIGALPVVLGAVFLIANKMKVFDKMKASMVNGMLAVQGSFARAREESNRFRSTMTASGTVVTGFGGTVTRTARTVGTRFKAMGIAVKTFSIGMKSALASTGIGLLIVGIGSAIEWLVGKYQDKKNKEEELVKLNKKMVEGYRSHRDGMDSMIDRYEELSKKQRLTKEEQEEFNGLQKDFANEIPTTVEYIDANGEAHMKSADAIRYEIEQVKQLSHEQAKLEMMKYEENLNKQAESYAEIADKVAKLRDEQAKLIEENGKTKLVDNGYGGYQSVEKVDNTKAIQENKVAVLMAEAEKTEMLKKTSKAIGDQTKSWLDANNMMSNIGDEQLQSIETFINYNEALLRSAPDEEEFRNRYNAIFSVATEIGTVFSDAFDIVDKSIKDDNPFKAEFLEGFDKQLDAIAKSIPNTFYQLTDAQGNVVKSSDDVVNGLKEIINVTHLMGDATGKDTDYLISRLRIAGFSADDAGAYLASLSKEYSNVEIKSELASRGIDETTGSLEEMNEEAMEAIDLTSTLFGYSGTELEGIKSHIQAMELLVKVKGEDAKATEEYKKSQYALVDFLGISADELEKNKDKYYDIIEALGKLKLSEYDTSQSWSEFVKKQDLTPDEEKLVLGWNTAKDIITGTVRDIKEETSQEVEQTKIKIEEIFKNVNIELPRVDLTQIKGSVNYVEDDVNKIISKLEEFKIKVGSPTGVELFDSLLDDLSRTDGKIDNTQTNIGKLRAILNTAIQNPELLNNVKAEVDETKGKVDSANQSVDLFKQNIAGGTPTGTPFVQPAKDALNEFKTKNEEVSEQFKNSLSIFSTPINPRFNTENMLDGISILKQSEDSAKKAEDAVQGTVSAGSEVAIVSNDMKIVEAQAKTVKSKIEELNSTLGLLGEKFSTGGVRSEIGKIGDKSDSTKGKIGSLRKSLESISSVNIGNLPQYIGQIVTLSISLANATEKARATASAQNNVISAFSRVVEVTKSYNSAVSIAGTNIGYAYNKIAQMISVATQLIINQYQRNVTAIGIMVGAIDKALKDMVGDFDRATKQATSKVNTMTNKMHKEFKSGMNDIVSTASGVPARIGKAIRDNMSKASSAMDEVAKDMVKRFKSELGIHSPSRVFEDLGYWTIKGLANGLSGEDLKSLGKNVFDDFGGGVFDSWDMIKAYVSGDWSNVVGNAGSGVQQWAGLATKALTMTGQFSDANLQRLLYQMQTESGGNPSAINLWDSNAKAGIPSKGLMQVIDPTFRAYAMSGYNKNIYDPLSNMLASIRYAISRYGSLAKAYRGVGYAKGGLIEEEHMAMVGEENKREMIIPLEQHRNRALGLWTQAGQFLGIDPQLLEVFRGKRGKGGMASSSTGTFGTSSGEGGGESGGGDSGTSGVLQHSIYDGIKTMDGGYEFISLASKYENRPDAFTYSKDERSIAGYESQISIIEAKMKGLAENTVKYRDSLKSVIALQNKHLQAEKKYLSTLEKRQKRIDKELKKLPKVSKQTTKQREQYNKLMEEYDGNISKINSLKSSIENNIVDIKDKSFELFNDFVDEIVGKYDSAIKKIEDRIDNTDFQIDVLGFVNPDDMEKLLNAQISKANDLQKQQSTGKNKVDSLQKEYDKVSRSKGKSSKEAKALKEQLDKAKEDYEDYTLAVLKAEKDIKDTRAEIADNSIKVLKDYYSNAKDMAVKALDKEKEVLEKAHKEKMDMYDKESEKISSVYDERIKAMDKEKEASTYQEELDAKNTKKAELANKISILSRNSDPESKKKLADLKAEMGELDKEIADFRKQRQDELLRESLEEQKQAQLDEIEKEKEAEDTKHQSALDKLEEQKEAVTKQYEDLINNDKYWADMRNKAITGNFTTITNELAKMKTNIDNMNKGIFDGLFKEFKNLSNETKKAVAEDNGLIVDNMDFNSKDVIKNANQANKAKGYKMTDGKVQNNGTKVITPKQTTPASKPSSKPSTSKPSTSKPKSDSPSTKTEYYTIKKGDNFWDIESRYGLAHGSLAKLNPKVNPKKLQIGQKIVLRKGSTSSSSSSKPATSNSSQRKTTSALNFRKSPAYGNNVMMTIPKNAKVDYVGMEKGWAKIKYKGKTGYVGSSYLKKFDTGGYTGDWAGKEGKVAMLHKKELVLNERQTSDILDTAKIMDKVANIIPTVKRATVNSKLATAGSITNINYGDINIKIENGDKKKSKAIADEIIKGLKKKGS